MASNVAGTYAMAKTRNEVSSNSHEYYFSRTNIEMGHGGTGTADVTIILEKVPRTQKELIEMLCNKYLKECKIPDTIEEILKKHYSCYII